MLEGNAKLIVDMGNSETRILTIMGETQSGLPRRSFTNVSNRYAENNPNLKIVDPINEDNSVIFSTDTGEYAGGLLVDREYANRAIRPTSLLKKYRNTSNVLVLHRAFLEGYRAIAAMYDVDLDEIDVTWEVTVLMPPADITEEGSKAMAEMIRSVTELNFSMPALHKEIVIPPGKISIVAEGMSAFIGVLFDRGGDIREGYEYLADSTTLVVDVGAGTTDFLVAKDGSAIESTKYTVNTGGNNVSTALRSRLNNVHDVSIDQAAAREAVVTGQIRRGSEILSVTEDLATVKQDVAYSLIDELQGFFESSNYPASNINYLLVVGGGSLSSDVEGIEPLSKYLVEKLEAFAPGVGLVEIPDKHKDAMNPRVLNIMGAGTQATMS